MKKRIGLALLAASLLAFSSPAFATPNPDKQAEKDAINAIKEQIKALQSDLRDAQKAGDDAAIAALKAQINDLRDERKEVRASFHM
jgi:peptidoglycan hydrolase CwlO-like protein